MAHKIYDNFYLSNEVEDQFNSHLDLQQFCTVDNSLVGTAGMKRKINVYKATAGTEKLKMGEGNTKSFWIALIPAVLLLVQVIAAVFGYTLDLGELGDKLLAVVNALFAVLTILGIVTDPTTAGIGDSKQALTYETPKKEDAV